MLAAFGDSPEVRRTATETLKRRDPREFADLLIGFLRDPIKYKVKPVGGPGSPGELFIEGKQANVSRDAIPRRKVPRPTGKPGDRLAYDGNGLPVIQRPLGVPQTKRITINAFGSNPSPPLASQAPRSVRTRQQGSSESLTSSGLGSDPGAAHRPGDRSISGLTSYPALASGSDMPRIALVAIYPDRLTPISASTSDDWPRSRSARWNSRPRRSAAVAQQQLQNDVESLERYNATHQDSSTGGSSRSSRRSPARTSGTTQETWQKWWVDQIGYTAHAPEGVRTTPTIIEEVPLAYQPAARPDRHDRSRRRLSADELLRGRHSGPYALRRPADRNPEGRGPGPHPGHQDGGPRLQADPGRPPQPAEPHLPHHPRRRDRSSAAISTASGRRAKAGSWRATSSLPDAVRPRWPSPRRRRRSTLPGGSSSRYIDGVVGTSK